MACCGVVPVGILSVCHRQIFWKPSMQVAKLGLAAPTARAWPETKTDGRRGGPQRTDSAFECHSCAALEDCLGRGAVQGTCLEENRRAHARAKCDHGLAERYATERCRSRISEPFLGDFRGGWMLPRFGAVFGLMGGTADHSR